MNILVIPSWYSNDTNPTNGSFFREQALELSKAGHTVIVAYVEETLKNLSDEEKKVKCSNDEGLITYRLFSRKLPKSGNIGTSFAVRKGLLNVFEIINQEYKIDVIHLHSCIWAGLGATAISKKYNIPLVITEHSSYYKRCKQYFWEILINNYVLNSADSLICVSSALKNTISKYRDDDDIEVIPNMIDCESFNYKINCNLKKFTFLSVCYLNSNKRIDLLIKAFANQFSGLDCELIVGGDGPEKERLISLASELKIENQVKFLGHLDREEVMKTMRDCHVFVLPSKVETFGIVLIEALSCGKPVISCKNGGSEDIINEKNGIIIDKDDFISLGKAMLTIKENYEKYNSEAISEECKEKYSKDLIIKRIEEVYFKVVNSKTPKN